MNLLQKKGLNKIKDILRKSPFNMMNDFMFCHIYNDSNLTRIKKTLELIPAAKENAVLLDIGCYAPMISLYTEIFGYKDIVAIANYDWDTLSKKLDKVNTYSNLKLNIHIQDVEKKPLPLNDSSVDIVFMFEVLEHFSIDPAFVISEVNRVLKTGGIFLISTPNAINSYATLRILLGKNPVNEPYNGVDGNRHNRLYSPDELIKLATNFGFEMLTCKTANTQKSLFYKISQTFSCIIDFFNLFRLKNFYSYRGGIILMALRKAGEVKEPRPDWLYISEEIYSTWYEKNKKK